jgi:hypothetical protein
VSAPPAAGWVRITSADPPITLLVRLGLDRPNVTAGYGGWNEVARPRRRPLTVWQGSPGLRMDLPVLIDGWKTGASIERQIAQLSKLGFPVASDGSPPRIRLRARGGTVPNQSKVWVVDAISWGDALANAKGNRVRQQATLSLLEFIADVRIDQDSAANRQKLKQSMATTKVGAAAKRVLAGPKRGASTPTQKTATFASGDTLISMAAKYLGDANRWPEIAQLNGIRDPRSIPIGKVIRLP